MQKRINEWCDYFVGHPLSALYQKGNYQEYKNTIELLNKFIAMEEQVCVETEEEFNAKCYMLQELIESGYLQVKEN